MLNQPTQVQGAPQARRAINGAMGNLLSYPHGQEAAWSRFISVPEAEVDACSISGDVTAGKSRRHRQSRRLHISDVSPAARDRTYGNREERRVIEKIETQAAKRLGEGVRDSAKARFYKTDGVTSRKRLEKKK